MLRCSYLDHESVRDHDVLSQATAEARQMQDPLLITCHRVEQYSDTPDNELTYLAGHKMKKISGDVEVLTRLLSLSMGLKSQIIGEWPIQNQVSNYIESLPDKDPMKKMGYKTVSLSERLREDFRLSSPSHCILALREISNNTHSKVLVSVGAGMIGKEVARNASMLGYSEMYLLSRDRKRARKRMKGILQKNQIVSEEHLHDHIAGKEYDLVIATTNANEEYRNKILSLTENEKCKGIVDVSEDVLSTTRGDTVTLYNQAMEEIIAAHNHPLHTLREDLLRMLPHIIEQRFEDLF